MSNYPNANSGNVGFVGDGDETRSDRTGTDAQADERPGVRQGNRPRDLPTGCTGSSPAETVVGRPAGLATGWERESVPPDGGTQ